MHLAVDSHGMPARIRITSGTTADCTEACVLIEGIDAENLLADRAYDTNDILQHCADNDIEGLTGRGESWNVGRDHNGRGVGDSDLARVHVDAHTAKE